jgi:hypothetical protein
MRAHLLMRTHLLKLQRPKGRENGPGHAGPFFFWLQAMPRDAAEMVTCRRRVSASYKDIA